MKKIIASLLMAPMMAVAQTYPSPTFNTITLQNPLTAANGGTGITSLGTGVATALGSAVSGSGSIALTTSPTFVTPALGTPSAAVLTNATGLPISTGVSGLGTGVATALGSAVSGSGSIALTTSPTFTTPALGTPSSATLTNATGLPISTGVSGLGTGVAAALGSAVTGSGGIALATSPTFTTSASVSSAAASGSILTLSATSNTASGAQILLTGNGGTTPSKYLRVLGGVFGIVNDAGNTAILSLDDSGNLTTGGSLTTSQTGGIVGTTTNNNANAGSVGEYVSSATNAASIANNTPTNVTSISLTAGDWDVAGSVLYLPQTGDTLTSIQTAINTTSAAIPSWTAIPYQVQGNIAITAGGAITGHVTAIRLSLSGTTTVYLVSLVIHTGGTCNTQGYLRARRVR